mmetsp:Transcript_3691/g.5607  ORF Transcript_3691/g.5607 Transcript_3691/m.5607 type:complete len:82 (+) Transcript_3691:1077-1322(+)
MARIPNKTNGKENRKSLHVYFYWDFSNHKNTTKDFFQNTFSKTYMERDIHAPHEAQFHPIEVFVSYMYFSNNVPNKHVLIF